MIEFNCAYCNNWIDKELFSNHMLDHMMDKDDLGTIKIPNTYEDMRRRFTSLGLFDERVTNE